MTALSVAQSVASVVGLEIPDAVVSSGDREHVELREVMKEAAECILDAHDWQLLKLRHTITGDNATENWPLPADYYKFPKDAQLWSNALEAPLTHVQSANRWEDLETRSYDFVEGVWILLGGEIRIKPALNAGELVRFYYQSNKIWADSGATAKATLTADDDTFRLGERLLKLGTIWAYKKNKGLPYAEDLADYEYALADAVQRDKGPTMIAIGSPRRPRDVAVAYPQSITP